MPRVPDKPITAQSPTTGVAGEAPTTAPSVAPSAGTAGAATPFTSDGMDAPIKPQVSRHISTNLFGEKEQLQVIPEGVPPPLGSPQSAEARTSQGEDVRLKAKLMGLVGTSSRMGHTDAEAFADAIRQAPVVGPLSFKAIKSIIERSDFETVEDIREIRLALALKYSAEFKAHHGESDIVQDTMQLAMRLSANGATIGPAQMEKILLVAGLEGIPSPEVNGLLAKLPGTFEVSEPAQSILSVFLRDLPITEPREWTYFVYMGSDNDLAAQGLADINEMESQLQKVAKFMNVAVLYDGSKEHNPSGNHNFSEGAKLVLIQQDSGENGDKIISKDIKVPRHTDLGQLFHKTNGELNMGSPETLKAALQFIETYVPSEKLFVDIWSHGSSWRGAVEDQTNGSRAMSANDFVDAFSVLKKPADVVGFDACSMANLEFASTFAKTGSKYLVGSVEQIVAEGFSYDVLLPMLAQAHAKEGTLNAKEFATTVVRAFDGVGEHSVESKSKPETLSAVDLSNASDFLKDVNSFGQILVEAGGRANEAISEAIRNVTKVDKGGADLGHFCVLLMERFESTTPVHKEAARIRKILQNAVVANQVGPRNSTIEGLSIYMPKCGYSFSSDYGDGAWAKELPAWVELISAQAPLGPELFEKMFSAITKNLVASDFIDAAELRSTLTAALEAGLTEQEAFKAMMAKARRAIPMGTKIHSNAQEMDDFGSGYVVDAYWQSRSWFSNHELETKIMDWLSNESQEVVAAAQTAYLDNLAEGNFYDAIEAMLQSLPPRVSANPAKLSFHALMRKADHSLRRWEKDNGESPEPRPERDRKLAELYMGLTQQPKEALFLEPLVNYLAPEDYSEAVETAAVARRQGKSVLEAVQAGIDEIEGDISLEAARKLDWEFLAGPLNLASQSNSAEFKSWHADLVEYINAGWGERIFLSIFG